MERRRREEILVFSDRRIGSPVSAIQRGERNKMTNRSTGERVSFNGIPAAFTVVSDTEIQATVPAGATTGTVTIDTPGGGTLTSNAIFQVD
jgi:uncharacterized protein (TIGR03437 family)